MKVVCITNDVENLTINGLVSEHIALDVQNEALPRLLALYQKYNVYATFYCLASFVEQYPDIVHQIQAAGHEVACHGWVHDGSMAFDTLEYSEQVNHLNHAKSILESLSGTTISSFRAPALRVNKLTPRALIETHFSTDSSIAPQRLDAFMSLGSRKKLQWIRACRSIYKTSSDNLARVGESGITEVPVSAFGLPYIGTLMRVSPFLLKLTRRFLFWETRGNNNKVVTFLYHPSEAVKETPEEMKPRKRKGGLLGHWFSDVLRVQLKSRNLGPESLALLENELAFWQKKHYEFKRVCDVV